MSGAEGRLGTVLEVLSTRDERGHRIRVQWDGTIRGDVWADPALALAAGDRVLSEVEGRLLLRRALVLRVREADGSVNEEAYAGEVERAAAATAHHARGATCLGVGVAPSAPMADAEVAVLFAGFEE